MPVADSLIADETVVFESKKHWMAPIRASLRAAAMIVGAALLRWLSPDGDGVFGWIDTIMDLVAIGLVIGGIAWIVYNVVVWRTAEFTITNMRVLREEGLLHRRSSTTLLSSLSDVRSSVGVLGRRIGYGDVMLLTQSGGAGEDRFLCITKPVEFRNAVMTQKMAGPGQPISTAAAPAVAAAPEPVQAPVTPAARVTPVPTPTSADDAETLKRLADLRDSGAITAEDYEAKKAEILARM